MNMNAENGDNISFNSQFIHKYSCENNNENTNKPIAYHYTSPEAFLSIINSKTIRFTDIRYMNDKSEILYFMKMLITFMESESAQKYPYAIELVNDMLKENDFEKIKNLESDNIVYKDFKNIKYHKRRNFVFCTSNKPDLLYMWNYYVKNNLHQGYNIGFNKMKLIKTFDTNNKREYDSFDVYYGNVVYKKEHQLKEIESIMKSIDDYIKYKQSSQPETINSSKNYAQLHLRDKINSTAIFFKSDYFKEEHEFRIVIDILDDNIPRNQEEAKKYFGHNNQRMYEDFCSNNGLIVPYLNVKIPSDSISRIYMSPITETNIAKESLKEFLKKNELNDVTICKSNIPIRF